MSTEETQEAARRLQEKFLDAMGPKLVQLLEDPRVCDVMINADGRVFVERAGVGMELTELSVSAAKRAAMVKTAVVLDGGGSHRDGASILEACIPGRGWRFEGILPPTVAAPVLSIRKPSPVVYRLESYVARGELTREAFAALQAALVDRRNVLVVGGTGSGKTTLVNALLLEVAELCPNDRVAVLEDTTELKVSCANSVSMVSSHAVTLYDLLRASMRLRPDRIVVGEVRGSEAQVMLAAWNTGHPGGVCTVHADSAEAGLLRLEQLCSLDGGSRDAARLEIAQAVHVVVYVERREGRRSVRSVVEVKGLGPGGEFLCNRIA